MAPPRSRQSAGARGSRDPRLAAELAAAQQQAPPDVTGDPLQDQAIADAAAEGDDTQQGYDDDGPELFEGETFELGVTLNVDVTGNGKHDFVPGKYTAIVQPGETPEQLFNRVSTFINDAVISQAHAISERWAEYEAAVQARSEQAVRIAGGRRQ